MRSRRLLIRQMKEDDANSFLTGISDRALRVSYGFPAEIDPSVSRNIFLRFCSLQRAYSLIRRNTGEMIGFLLDVEPELPESILAELPKPGRTLAFSVFPPFQRQGYMEEALRAYIPSIGAAYIHCGCFTENEPSRNLLAKLGFHEFSRHPFGTRIIIDEILPLQNQKYLQDQ